MGRGTYAKHVSGMTTRLPQQVLFAWWILPGISSGKKEVGLGGVLCPSNNKDSSLFSPCVHLLWRRTMSWCMCEGQRTTYGSLVSSAM